MEIGNLEIWKMHAFFYKIPKFKGLVNCEIWKKQKYFFQITKFANIGSNTDMPESVPDF